MCDKKKGVYHLYTMMSLTYVKHILKNKPYTPGRKMISDTSVDNMTIYSNSLISNLHYR